MGIKRYIFDNYRNIIDFNTLRSQKREYLKNSKKIDNNCLQNLKQSDPYFVLSTGRCGTDYLTRALYSSSKIYANHNKAPELGRLSNFPVQEQNFEISKGIILGARAELIEHVYLSNLIYVETNNKLTFYAKEIKSIFPNAKFIHLFRNKSHFIKSAINRGYFSSEYVMNSHIKIPNNLKNSSNELKAEWIYDYTNRFIINFKKSLKGTEIITIKSEDLFNKNETKNLIENFLGLDHNELKWPKGKVNKS